MTSKRLFVESWVYYNDSLVKLTYEDGSEVFLDKAVFNREFQTVISNDKETVLRDFASDIQLTSE